MIVVVMVSSVKQLEINVAIFLMVLSALGCAGSQPVRMQLPPGARIGILEQSSKICSV